jgi:hypothetical protein
MQELEQRMEQLPKERKVTCQQNTQENSLNESVLPAKAGSRSIQNLWDTEYPLSCA